MTPLAAPWARGTRFIEQPEPHSAVSKPLVLTGPSVENFVDLTIYAKRQLVVRIADVHFVDADTGVQCFPPGRFTGYHKLLRECIHLCGSLRSFQTLFEADVDQKLHKRQPWIKFIMAGNANTHLHVD